MRRLTVPTSAACAALLLAACGGSARHVSTRTRTNRPARTFTGTVQARPSTVRAVTPPPSAPAIERAATTTAAEPGFRAAVSASIRLPQFNGNPLTARGDGFFDPRSSSGTLDVAVELPGLLGLGGPLPTQLRLVGGEAYAQVPADLAGELPRADAWLETSLAALDLGGTLDPAEILADTARDATQRVPDQRARVTIDPATGLIRTIVLSWSEPGGYHVHVGLRLTGFSAQPATVAPPASQTGRLQTKLQALGF